MLRCTVPGCAGSYCVVRRHADADESYQISVDLKKSAANTDTASVAVVAVVTAQTVYGARHGLESLAQLVATPAGIISGVSHRDESQCARAIPGWVSREGGVWRSRSVVQSERGAAGGGKHPQHPHAPCSIRVNVPPATLAAAAAASIPAVKPVGMLECWNAKASLEATAGGRSIHLTHAPHPPVIAPLVHAIARHCTLSHTHCMLQRNIARPHMAHLGQCFHRHDAGRFTGILVRHDIMHVPRQSTATVLHFQCVHSGVKCSRPHGYTL